MPTASGDNAASIDTAIGRLALRRATLDDVGAVLEIMVDAAQLPLTRGIDMWGWVRTPSGERVVRERIENDEVYLAELPGGRAIATVCVQWSDPETWGEKGRDDTAGYVHGLAVLREHHGQGIGKALVDWAAARITARGRRRLRLDCMGENSQLCKYYQDDLSLRPVGTTHGKGWSAQLFEKELNFDAQGGERPS
jgi:ribosomal protein S18 acetylase RimI-like enzyme